MTPHFGRSITLALLLGIVAGCGLSKESQSDGEISDRIGNGDSVVVDGVTYRLADLYFRPYSQDGFTFDDQMRARLVLLKDNLERWSVPIAPLFDEQIFSDLVKFYLVATLPSGCDDVMDIPGRPSAQFACTRGYVTWIVPRYFLPLSPEEKAAAIVHERLHAFSPSQPHEVIVPFVIGTISMQAAYPALDSRPTLDADALVRLRALRFSARQLGFMRTDPMADYDMHAFGGGFFKGGSVASTAFLGLGAILTDSVVAAGAMIGDATIDASTIGAGAEVGLAGAGGRALIERSTLLDRAVVARGTRLVGVTVGANR